LDVTYFTFHRQLESTHEEAMEHAVEAAQSMNPAGMSDRDKEDFRVGVTAVLDYLHGFWTGLDRRETPPRRRSHAWHHHAA
ncbi:MAG TPA: hypothetical protein VJ746_05960, partial [Nitrospira sp.]|nr:hypothetical protein [Nitrospira sp.]